MTDPKHILYFDGSCEPTNPGGHMTFSWVLRDTAGNTIDKNAEFVPAAPMNTNNIAEWQALIAGVKAFRTRVLDFPLMIYGDSKLVVFQLNGDWQCKRDHLLKLRDEARALLNGNVWYAQHIGREHNEEADALGRAKYLEIVGREMPTRQKKSA